MLNFKHMSKYTSLIITFLILTAPGTGVLAETSSGTPLQTITLHDGSSIQGKLIAISGDEYTIQNETMGEIKVPVSKIAGINASAGAPGVNPGMALQAGQLPAMPAGGLQLNASHLSIMQDPQIMALLQELLADPEIAGLVQDPALMQAAMTMNPETIQNNPAAQKLIQNPKMQKIMALTAQKLQASGQLTPQPQQ